MDYSPPVSSVHGDSPGKNNEVSCHTLLQGIFLTQGSNPGLPHCRWILYHLSHQGSPRTGVGSLSLLQGIFPTQELNWGFLNCRQILYQLIYQEAIILNHRHLTSHLSITKILVMVSITDIASTIRPLMLP